jgi:hypothetical protein
LGREILLKEVDKKQPKYAEYSELVFKGLFDTFLLWSEKKGYSIPPAVVELIDNFASGEINLSKLEIGLKALQNPLTKEDQTSQVSIENIAATPGTPLMETPPVQEDPEDASQQTATETPEKEGKEEVEQKKRGRKSLTEYLNPKDLVPTLLPILKTSFACNPKDDDFIPPARFIHAYGAFLPEVKYLFKRLHPKGKRRRLPPILLFFRCAFCY